MNISIQNRSRVLIGMNLLLFVLLLWQFHPVPDDRAQSQYVTSQASSIAISKIRYGLYDGYVGYRNVLKELLKIEGDNDRGIPISRINQAIRRAVNLDDFASGGKHWMPCLPTWSDFVSTAFLIFGANIKSLFYLYMLLLTVSFLTFMMTFRRVPEHLYLSLTVIITLIVVLNSPAMETMTRVSHRFWTYLAILPAFHIAILFMEHHDRTRWKLAGTLIQSGILVFIIHCRNVAIYEFIFIFVAVPVYLFMVHMIRSGGVSALRPLVRKYKIWPLIVVLICFAAISVSSKVRLHPDYSGINTNYPFWHMIYVSLCAHPDACAKYDICKFSDAVAYGLVEKKMNKVFDGRVWGDLAEGVNPKEAKFIVFFSPVYSDILRDEVLRIVRTDPWFFISSFYYKIINFPPVYAKGSQGVGGYIGGVHLLYDSIFPIFSLRWLLIFMAAAGFYVARTSRSWYGNLAIVFLMFISCFVMLLMAYPDFSTIMDPAFMATLIMYIVMSLMVCYFCSLIMMVMKRIRSKWGS